MSQVGRMGMRDGEISAQVEAQNVESVIEVVEALVVAAEHLSGRSLLKQASAPRTQLAASALDLADWELEDERGSADLATAWEEVQG